MTAPVWGVVSLDGEPVGEDRRFLVLDLDHPDEPARAALRAFAAAVRDEDPELASLVANAVAGGVRVRRLAPYAHPAAARDRALRPSRRDERRRTR